MMNRPSIFTIMVIIASLFYPFSHAISNESSVVAEFSGTLIEIPPCTLRPGDEEITMMFSTITVRELKEQKRTKGFPFTIHLDNCDISRQGTVKIFFTGTESPSSTGLLMPDPSSTSNGIAIGIETPDGELLSINDPAKYLSLQLAESTMFTLQAFIQVEDESNLTEGTFYASANYIIEYE